MNNDRKNRPSSSDFEVTPVRKPTQQQEYTVEEFSPRSSRPSNRSEALKNTCKSNDIPVFEVSSVREERQVKSTPRQSVPRTRQTETPSRSERTISRPRVQESEFEVSSFTQNKRAATPERQSRPLSFERPVAQREVSNRVRQTERPRVASSDNEFVRPAQRPRREENVVNERSRATENTRRERVRATEVTSRRQENQRAQIAERRRELDSQLSHFTYQGKQPRNYAISVAITTFKILLI